MLKKIFMAFVAALTAISAQLPILLDIPTLPVNRTIDMDRFALTWHDEFDGDSVDPAKWGTEWWITMRKGGYWHEDMAFVQDGNLVIRTEYKDTPLENRYYEKWKDSIHFDAYKPGYYSAQLTSAGKFEQKYGYFECRCILPPGKGLWSAFWMMNEGVYNVDGSGQDGTELDIFESMYYRKHRFGIDAVSANLHFDGYAKGEHQYKHVGEFLLENDPYSTFNTYGMEWNENEYIFYINGREYARSDFGGVSENPEFLLLSVEVAGENGVPAKNPSTGKIAQNKNWPIDFVVDYVRCYQYKELL